MRKIEGRASKRLALCFLGEGLGSDVPSQHKGTSWFENSFCVLFFLLISTFPQESKGTSTFSFPQRTQVTGEKKEIGSPQTQSMRMKVRAYTKKGRTTQTSRLGSVESTSCLFGDFFLFFRVTRLGRVDECTCALHKSICRGRKNRARKRKKVKRKNRMRNESVVVVSFVTYRKGKLHLHRIPFSICFSFD